MSSSEVNPKTLSPADLRLLKQAQRVGQSADAPPSPCMSVCRMAELSIDRNGVASYCVGCWRTLSEIATWGTSDVTSKREIWRLIDARLTALAQTP